jgi:hypothetical protein
LPIYSDKIYRRGKEPRIKQSELTVTSGIHF